MYTFTTQTIYVYNISYIEQGFLLCKMAQWRIDVDVIDAVRKKVEETDLSITKQLNKDLRQLYGLKRAKKDE